MATELKVTTSKRAKTGTAEARRLRHQGVVPAVLYDDKAEATSIQLNGHDFLMQMRGHFAASRLMTLDLDGVEKKVLVREIQRHPVSGDLIHVDFFEVSMTKKMRIEIPIRFVNEPVGVTVGGGVLQHLLRELTVECLPGDLVESIDVDVSALAVGQSLLAGKIPLDSRFTLITDKNLAVATVTEQKAEEEVAPAEGEAAAAGSEPEVIAKKKEGDEAAAGEGAEKKDGEKKPADKKAAAPAKEAKK